MSFLLQSFFLNTPSRTSSSDSLVTTCAWNLQDATFYYSHVRTAQSRNGDFRLIHIMKIFNQNINVMDRNGCQIGVLYPLGKWKFSPQIAKLLLSDRWTDAIMDGSIWNSNKDKACQDVAELYMGQIKKTCIMIRKYSNV